MTNYCEKEYEMQVNQQKMERLRRPLTACRVLYNTCPMPPSRHPAQKLYTGVDIEDRLHSSGLLARSRCCAGRRKRFAYFE